MTTTDTCPANMFGVHDWPNATAIMRGERDRCANCGAEGTRNPYPARYRGPDLPVDPHLLAGVRPKYEAQHDLDNEMRVATTFRLHMGWPRVVRRGTYDKIALQFEEVDEAGDPLVVAWGKAISRNVSVTRYPDYTYSLRKFTDLVVVAERTHIPSYLIVEWTDRLAYLEATRHVIQWLQAAGGRIDRHDPRDVERMAHFGLDLFSVIERAA